MSGLRVLHCSAHIVVIRFLIHDMERPHSRRQHRGDLQRHLLPSRGFLRRTGFGSCRLHALTRRHSLMHDRILMNVWMDPEHPQRLPDFVRTDCEDQMGQTSLCPTADRA